MALIETGRILYNEPIVVKVKSTHKDETVATVNFKIRLDLTPSHHQVLLCDITDTQDPFFLYSLILGESDFHTLKNEQRLLVDFQQFPSQLVKLLDETKKQGGPPSSGRVLGAFDATPAHNQSLMSSSPGAGSSAPVIFAVLNIVSGHEAVFSVTESNQFRELQHLSLHFRKGNDAAVKEYLAAKLQDYLNQNQDLQSRISLCEEDSAKMRESESVLRQDAEALKMQLMTTKESINAAHSKELADLKEAHAMSLSSIQQKLNQERAVLEKQLRDQISQKQHQLERQEKTNTELSEKLYKLELVFKQSQEKNELADQQHKQDTGEIQTLREACKVLEVVKFEQEKTINEQGCKILTLEERVNGREMNYSNQVQITKQLEDKQRHVEESLSENKQHCLELEERCSESAAEINKGNVIIANLQAQLKSLKSKLRVKTVALQQQEKTISELEKEVYQLEKAEELRKSELSDGRDRETRAQNDLEQTREKLNEAHSLIASNQQVIEYLNKQLTERDLKTFAPLSTVNLPLSRDNCSTTAALQSAQSGHTGLPNSKNTRPSPGRVSGFTQSTPGNVSTAAGSAGPTSTAGSDAEARQKRIEALLQSRGVPLVGPVRYKSEAD